MGLKAVLDTNAIITLLKNEGNLSDILRNYSEIYVSVIGGLELQSFQNINARDLVLMNSFLSQIIIVDLTHSNPQLLQEIIKKRKKSLNYLM